MAVWFAPRSLVANRWPALDPLSLFKQAQRPELNISTALWWRKANSFSLPRGMSPGRGWVLGIGEKVKALDMDAHDHSLMFSSGTGNRATVQTISGLTVVSAVGITTGISAAANNTAAYLLELADIRHYGPMSAASLACHLRTPEGPYYSSTTTYDTYKKLVDALWALLPAAFGALTHADGNYPGSTPDAHAFWGVPAWDALAAIFAETDNELVLTAAGAFSIEKRVNTTADFTASTDALSLNLKWVLDDAVPILSIKAHVPEKIRVIFLKNNSPWLGDATLTHTVDVATSITGVLAGTFHILRDTLIATCDETGAVTNSAALTTRANSRAADYLASINPPTENHYVASGAHLIVPDGAIDAVAWFDIGEGVKTEVITSTRVRRPSPPLPPFPSGGFFETATLTADLAFEGSATATISGGRSVTVYDWLLKTGETIASGKKVTISFRTSDGRWYVTGAQCP